jgi:hypothetical protein
MSAVLVDPANYRRLVSAAGLLKSDKSGEVVAALAAIERLLPEGTAVSDVFAAGLRPRDEDVADDNHKVMASWALQYADLTDWERNFCQSVFHFRHPSTKQLKALRGIVQRALGGEE